MVTPGPPPPPRVYVARQTFPVGRAIGAIVLVVAIAAAWKIRAAIAEAADAPGPSASAADIRQREILEAAIDRPGDVELARMYAAMNAQHFSHALPSMPVAWEPRLDEVGALANREFALEGMFGRIGSRTIILLHPRLKNDPAGLRRTLSHEMVHAALYSAGDASTDHGPAFQAVLRRLASEGAFEGIIASEEERESLRTWIDAESQRLDAERLQIERDGEDIARERAEVERLVAALDARTASTDGTQPPPTQSDIDDVNARRTAYNDRAMRANERADRHRASVDILNREIERYNLMVAYPDGHDERIARRR